MFSTLAITVMEKTKDIAILRSIGYTQSDISQIFLLQGLTVLVVGVITGWIFAASVTLGVTKIPIRIRGIFSTDSFVVEWSIWHYIVSGLIAGVVVLLASWFPARRAAKVEPADIIRGTGG
jgi:lipoprotein-releasing system permease protein